LINPNSVSWTRCAHVLSELSLEERRVVKAIADGGSGPIDMEVLARLTSLGLLKDDGSVLSLTDDGRAIASWC